MERPEAPCSQVSSGRSGRQARGLRGSAEPKTSVAETSRAVLPLLLLLFLGVLLITYIPALSLALPAWLLGPAP